MEQPNLKDNQVGKVENGRKGIKDRPSNAKLVSNFFYFFAAVFFFPTIFFLTTTAWAKEMGILTVGALVFCVVVFILCGFGIRAGSEWAWWLSTAVTFVFSSVVVYGLITDISKTNAVSFLFIALFLIMHGKDLVRYCGVEKYSKAKRIILSSIPGIILIVYFIVREII